MADGKQPQDELPEAEIAERVDRAVRRMMEAPPKARKELAPKKTARKPAKKRGGRSES